MALATYNGTNLYSVVGQNIDGAMTQKAVTDELNIQFDGFSLGAAVVENFIVHGSGNWGYYRGNTNRGWTHYLIINDGYEKLDYKVYGDNSYASYITLYSTTSVTSSGGIAGKKVSSTGWYEGTIDLTLYPTAKLIVVSTVTSNIDSSYATLHKPVKKVIGDMSPIVSSNSASVALLNKITIKNYHYDYTAADFVTNQLYIDANGDLRTETSSNAERLTLYIGSEIANGVISAYCGSVNADSAMIACYSDKIISSEYLLGSPIMLKNGNKSSSMSIPEGTKMIIVTNRTGSLSTPTATLTYTALPENEEKFNIIGETLASIDDNINGSGKTTYFGKRIEFDIMAQPRKCTRNVVYTEQWVDSSTSIRYKTQSHAMYNGKLFVFLDGGTCSVYTFDDGVNNITWVEDVPIGLSSHCNNAQFSNIFYESSDTYPLILISGDSPNGSNAIHWVRITESEGHVAFSEIKSVALNIPYAQFSGTIVANFTAKRMFMTCFKMYYGTTSGNESYIFEIPFVGYDSAKTEINSNDDVRLVFSMSPRITWQGGCEHQGKLYLPASHIQQINGIPIGTMTINGVSVNGTLAPSILVIDEDTGNIESVLSMPNNHEMEGLCLYDKNLYLTQREGGTSHSSSDTIFWIVKYTF